ncbi:MAG: ABC transporter ATP-binding protein [Chloroflexi bacterium]|nr:ABC transporter ATP-binding protein [Chloroflexota bacterium]
MKDNPASPQGRPLVIQAKGLVKRYGKRMAVDGITFAVAAQECFGFLGPNGAGKTSTIRMITCTSPITDGELLVNGMNVAKEGRRIKASIGLVPQEENLDPDLTALQNLLVYARYFGMSTEQAQQRAREALRFFALEERQHSRIQELSGGMRKRLLIARALLHQPKLIILDEPTTGLDPQARHMVWERLNTLKQNGTTLLLCTHYMEEAAYLCDRLVIMDKGDILVEGTPADVVRRGVGPTVGELRVTSADKQRVLTRLQSIGVTWYDLGDRLYVFDGDGKLDGLEVTQRPANLEDVFLRLTGRTLDVETEHEE